MTSREQLQADIALERAKNVQALADCHDFLAQLAEHNDMMAHLDGVEGLRAVQMQIRERVLAIIPQLQDQRIWLDEATSVTTW